MCKAHLKFDLFELFYSLGYDSWVFIINSVGYEMFEMVLLILLFLMMAEVIKSNKFGFTI
jgi:hypothetical protein